MRHWLVISDASLIAWGVTYVTNPSVKRHAMDASPMTHQWRVVMHQWRLNDSWVPRHEHRTSDASFAYLCTPGWTGLPTKLQALSFWRALHLTMKIHKYNDHRILPILAPQNYFQGLLLPILTPPRFLADYVRLSRRQYQKMESSERLPF